MKIKICGLTTLSDTLIAAEAGADMLGFNLYPDSPRSIGQRECRRMVARVKNEHPGIQCVGIFVNWPVWRVKEAIQFCGLHLAQLSGDESRRDLLSLEEMAFKAIPLGDADQAWDAVKEIPTRRLAPLLLLDSYVPGSYGGSGNIADWDLAAQIASRYPVLLAGGLTPRNVASAIEHVHPWGVDVASGVERSPGIKDHLLLRAFIETARSSSPSSPHTTAEETA